MLDDGTLAVGQRPDRPVQLDGGLGIGNAVGRVGDTGQVTRVLTVAGDEAPMPTSLGTGEVPQRPLDVQGGEAG